MKLKKILFRLSLVAVATCVSGISFAADKVAPSQAVISGKLNCFDVGVRSMEPVGDRDGHTIQTGGYICHAEGGLQDGAVLTANNIVEDDKGVGVLLSDVGVSRKSGAMAVWHSTEGKIIVTFANGKFVGWTGAGKGVFQLATGSMATLTGKTYSWKAHFTGLGQYEIEYTFD
jgi:hypothetical protein